MIFRYEYPGGVWVDLERPSVDEIQMALLVLHFPAYERDGGETKNQEIDFVVGTHRAIAGELRETNTALLGARQNEIMKTLTTITVLVLPLELFASVLVLHLPGTPLLDNPNAFSIVLAIMLTSVGLTTLFFARKRWIF